MFPLSSLETIYMKHKKIYFLTKKMKKKKKKKKEKRNMFKMTSAENFTQHAKR